MMDWRNKCNRIKTVNLVVSIKNNLRAIHIDIIDEGKITEVRKCY